MGLVKRAPAPEAPADERRERSRDVAGLLEQLRSPAAEARRRAALDLADVEDAVTALLAAASAEAVPTVRDALLTTLSAHDLPQVAVELATWLGGEDAGRRNAAVAALQTMPTASAAVLDDLLVVDDIRVRTLAVMVLSCLPHPGVHGWLRTVVTSDPDANVVAAAVDAAQTLEEGVGAELAVTASRRFPDNPYLAFLGSLAGPQ